MYENTIIKNLEKIDYGYIAFSDYFKIEAKKVILACFYPFFLKHSLFPFKTYIKKEYITASLIDNSKRFNAINLDKDLHSIRYHNDNKSYIIYVSESRKLGSNMDNNKRYTDLIWKTKINISDDIKYIGFDDKDLTIFESQYPVEGISYNSWVIMDEKIAVMDTVDARGTDAFFKNLENALDGRKPDYLIVQHLFQIMKMKIKKIKRKL